MDVEKIAQGIIDGIGGKENASSVSYCMTRVRMTVKNHDKVNKPQLEKISGVMKVLVIGNQYQIVVGGIVNEVYDAVVEKLGKDISQDGSVDELVKEDVELIKDNSNQRTTNRIKSTLGIAVETLSSIVSPIIPAMLAAGFIKTIAMIMVNVLNFSDTNTTYLLLNTLGDTIYSFFPMIIGWSAAKRFNANVGVTLVLTGFLINPGFSGIFEIVNKVTLFNIPVTNVYYGSSVLPSIFSVYLLSILEKKFRKVLPPSLRSIFVPFFSMTIVFPLLILVIGPIGVWGGELFASLFTSLYELNPILAGAFIGGLWQVLIIVGMHIAILGLVSGPNIAKFGRDNVIMTHAPSLICQMAAGFAVSIKAKNKELKREAFTLSISSLVAGSVVEPVMYGVNLKLKKPFIAVLIGGAVGGAITGASGAGTTAAVAFGIYTFPAYLGTGFTGLLAGCAIGAIVTFVLTFVFGFDEELYDQ
ncbi:PTS transporter subunit EIIC [Enterococcus raffinosus]|uniref:PTS transporter subunit EIIC n=1 Tax=Enterococcus raffinosus TaxID=71452 RepID=UPI002891B2AE|nr:PTS transporter subunit EIIC [Enterococcus raffinosus]MDT2557077.1 PTS transporter subunit EIIC [Enterococcus raffinosus]